MKKVWTYLMVSFLFIGCAMKSGHYHFVQKGESINVLSKKYRTNKNILLAANSNKIPKKGKWYFIPRKSGFISRKLVYKSYEKPANHYFSKGKFLWPVPSSYNISSNFGMRWGRKHEGLDIAARTGSSILSMADGVVVFSGTMGGYGNIIVIAHKNAFFSVYAHNHKNYTSKGQKVHRGQVIATVGSTGRSTGPHLHFEIRRHSRSLNPMAFYYKKKGRRIASK